MNFRTHFHLQYILYFFDQVENAVQQSTERNGRQCRSKEAYLLANHCKTESVCWIRFGDSVTEVSSNTSKLVSGVSKPPSTTEPWILPCRHGWLITDGRLTYTICLASVNQICTFFKVTQLLKEKIEFSLILIYIKFKTTANLLLAHDVKEKWSTDIWVHKLSMYVHQFGRHRHLKNATNTLKMYSVIPPFWEKPATGFFWGLSVQ